MDNKFNVLQNMVNISKKLQIVLDLLNNKQEIDFVTLYFVEFSHFNIKSIIDTSQKQNFIIFSTVNQLENESIQEYKIVYFDNNDKYINIDKQKVLNNLNQNLIIKEYNTILSQLSSQLKINTKVVKTPQEFLTQLSNLVKTFIDNSKKDIDEIQNLLKKDISLPIIKGQQWLDFVKLLKGKNVNLEISIIKGLENFIKDQNESVTKSVEGVQQIIIKSQSKYGNKQSILFTKSNGGFNISNYNSDTEVPDEIINSSIQIEDYENVNFQFILINIGEIFEYFKSLISDGKQEDIPDTIVEFFKEQKYKDIQIEVIKNSIQKGNEIHIPIRIVGKKTSFKDNFNNGYILNFIITGSNQDNYQKLIYNIINKFYVGNIDLKIDLKELGEDLLNSLKNQGGVIGQFTKQVLDVVDELSGYQKIFTTTQKLTSQVMNLFKNKQSKKYVTSPEQQPEELSQIKQQQKQKTDQDKEVELIFSPQTQNKQPDDEKQVLEKLYELPFSKLLFDDK